MKAAELRSVKIEFVQVLVGLCRRCFVESIVIWSTIDVNPQIILTELIAAAAKKFMQLKGNMNTDTCVTTYNLGNVWQNGPVLNIQSILSPLVLPQHLRLELKRLGWLKARSVRKPSHYLQRLQSRIHELIGRQNCRRKSGLLPRFGPSKVGFDEQIPKSIDLIQLRNDDRGFRFACRGASWHRILRVFKCKLIQWVAVKGKSVLLSPPKQLTSWTFLSYSARNKSFASNSPARFLLHSSTAGRSEYLWS